MDCKMTRAQFKAYQRLLAIVPHKITDSIDSVEIEITDEPEGWEEIDSYPAYRCWDEFDGPSEMTPDYDDLDVDTEVMAGWPTLVEAFLWSANLGAELAAADAYTRRAEQGFCNY